MMIFHWQMWSVSLPLLTLQTLINMLLVPNSATQLRSGVISPCCPRRGRASTHLQTKALQSLEEKVYLRSSLPSAVGDADHVLLLKEGAWLSTSCFFRSPCISRKKRTWDDDDGEDKTEDGKEFQLILWLGSAAVIFNVLRASCCGTVRLYRHYLTPVHSSLVV